LEVRLTCKPCTVRTTLWKNKYALVHWNVTTLRRRCASFALAWRMDSALAPRPLVMEDVTAAVTSSDALVIGLVTLPALAFGCAAPCIVQTEVRAAVPQASYHVTSLAHASLGPVNALHVCRITTRATVRTCTAVVTIQRAAFGGRKRERNFYIAVTSRTIHRGVFHLHWRNEWLLRTEGKS